MKAFVDKRYYTRYEVWLPRKVAEEKGIVVPVEISDISIEGARVKTDEPLPISVGSIVYLLVKWKISIKVKGEVRWLKKEGPFLEFGIKFLEVDMSTRQALAALISDYALSNLSEVYTR